VTQPTHPFLQRVAATNVSIIGEPFLVLRSPICVIIDKYVLKKLAKNSPFAAHAARVARRMVAMLRS
jgi:hypothetical protein